MHLAIGVPTPSAKPDPSKRESSATIGFPLEDRIAVTLLAALATGVGLLWLFSVPFHRGPDEAAHFQVVRFIAEHGRLPRFDPSELWVMQTAQGAVETYATFPPLPYILAALLTAILPSGDEFWASRTVSLCAYVGTVVLTYLLGQTLYPKCRAVALTAALLVAFLPQFSFTAAYINKDSMAAFECGVLFILLARMWRCRPTPLSAFATGAMVGAIATTRYTAYPIAALGLVGALGLALTSHAPWRLSGLVLGGAVGTSAWWFIRNLALYDELIPSRVVARAKELVGGNTLLVPVDLGLTPLTLSTQTDFWEMTLQSFVGVFGLQTVFLSPSLYATCTFAVFIAVLGLIKGVGLGAQPSGSRVPLGAAFLATAATLAGAVAISTYGEFSPQGRYLFPALPAIAMLLSLGWHQAAVKGDRPAAVTTVVGVGAAVVNAVSLFGILIPAEHEPRREIIVQIDRPDHPVPEDGTIEVLGWSLVQGGRPWKPLAPEVVEDYRRPVAKVTVSIGSQDPWISEAEYGLPRSDVSAFYGGDPDLVPVGYRLQISAWRLGVGEHMLSICASTRDGMVRTCTERTFRIENAGPKRL